MPKMIFHDIFDWLLLCRSHMHAYSNVNKRMQYGRLVMGGSIFRVFAYVLFHYCSRVFRTVFHSFSFFFSSAFPSNFDKWWVERIKYTEHCSLLKYATKKKLPKKKTVWSLTRVFFIHIEMPQLKPETVVEIIDYVMDWQNTYFPLFRHQRNPWK